MGGLDLSTTSGPDMALDLGVSSIDDMADSIDCLLSEYDVRERDKVLKATPVSFVLTGAGALIARDDTADAAVVCPR